jgi:ribose 5-phosphate isomerase B
MTKIFLASDHAGVELKSKIWLELSSKEYSQKYQVIDLGPQSSDSVDYPDYADLVCKNIHGLSLVSSDQNPSTATLSEIGILICGSGQGMSMRANKYSHVRAALCWNVEVAKLSREHNNANVLCLGARATPAELCLDIVRTFLNTNFLGERHQKRVLKVSKPV